MIRCSSSTIGRWRRFFPLVRVWSSPPWVMRHLKRKSAALNPKSYALGTSGSGIPLALAAAHTARHQAPTRLFAAASTSLDAGARKAIARPVWHKESGRTSRSTAFNIKPKPGKRWANTPPPDAGRASLRVPRGGLGRLIGSSAASRSGQRGHGWHAPAWEKQRWRASRLEPKRHLGRLDHEGGGLRRSHLCDVSVLLLVLIFLVRRKPTGRGGVFSLIPRRFYFS